MLKNAPNSLKMFVEVLEYPKCISFKNLNIFPTRDICLIRSLDYKDIFLHFYLSKIYYHSAITCDAPSTIAGGSTDCDESTVFGGTCTASCDSGYLMTGTATLTCQDSDNDGTGDFTTAPTCTGIILLCICFNCTCCNIYTVERTISEK